MTLHEGAELGVLLIVLLLEPFLRNLPLEGFNLVEFADRFLIQNVDAFKGTLPNSFLMVCKKQATELRALKEVLAVILLLGH